MNLTEKATMTKQGIPLRQVWLGGNSFLDTFIRYKNKGGKRRKSARAKAKQEINGAQGNATSVHVPYIDTVSFRLSVFANTTGRYTQDIEVYRSMSTYIHRYGHTPEHVRLFVFSCM